ncbi:MAG: hypothetical protein MUC60_05565 [Oscillatoria sp. Prado101]|nr:hypothetical protein [Oscillatoria sp. Prado101]
MSSGCACLSQRVRGRPCFRLGVPVETASKPVSDAVVAHRVRFDVLSQLGLYAPRIGQG